MSPSRVDFKIVAIIASSLIPIVDLFVSFMFSMTSLTEPASIMGITIHKYCYLTKEIYSEIMFLCFERLIIEISLRMSWMLSLGKFSKSIILIATVLPLCLSAVQVDFHTRPKEPTPMTVSSE